MIFDYSKIKGRMAELGYSQGRLAREAHIGYTSLNQKLNNRRDFTQDEMIRIADVLDFGAMQIGEYFFTI